MASSLNEVFSVYDRKSPKHAWTKYESWVSEYKAVESAKRRVEQLRETVEVDKRWKNGQVAMVQEEYKGHIANNLPKNTPMQRVWYVKE